MIYKVVIGKKALKALESLPGYVSDKLLTWIESVREIGLELVRLNRGLRDEALKGDRKGQRSIRLSKSYGAIYVVVRDEITFVRIEEVSKHDY